MPATRRSKRQLAAIRHKYAQQAAAIPTEYAANGAMLAKFPGTCYWCGDGFLAGQPIRFMSRQTLHDGPCSLAAHEAKQNAVP